MELKVNRKLYVVDIDSDTPLLWALRENLTLTGTKFSCGIGSCGACTVHVGRVPKRSCLLPVGAVGNWDVVNIEGLEGSVSEMREFMKSKGDQEPMTPQRFNFGKSRFQKGTLADRSPQIHDECHPPFCLGFREWIASYHVAPSEPVVSSIRPVKSVKLPPEASLDEHPRLNHFLASAFRIASS
jgi:hypothetical protein